MDKSRIADSFSASFATYADKAVVQREIAVEMVRLMRAAGFPDNEPVYEVGAGTGLLTARVLDAFTPSRMVANDLCLESRGYVTGLAGNVAFVHGDAESMPLPEGCSHVVSCSAIQWFDDLGGFFARMYAGLPPGGYLAFSTFGPDNLKEVREVSGMGLEYKSCAELDAMLRKGGFDVLHGGEDRRTAVFSGVSGLLRHIRETGTGGIPPALSGMAQVQRFRRDYEAKFSVPGGVAMTFHPVYFVARKPA